MAKIGQYEILYELGRGEMTIAHLAYDEVAGRTVVLKKTCLPESLSEEAKHEVRSRFLRHTTANLELSHPGIITTYHCHDQGDEPEPLISMEYVPGQNLRGWLQATERHELGEVLGIVEAVTDAVDAAHRVGVFHGDVRPGNIFVRWSDDTVKIGDFGIGPLSLSPPDLDRITAESAAYSAPECLNGNPADARSDLFSLAVILYEGLCGEHPFQRENARSTVSAVMSHEPDPVTERAPGMPTSVDEFFLRALAKEPNDRFPDGTSFLQELRYVRKEFEESRQKEVPATTETDVARAVDVPEREAVPEQLSDEPPVAMKQPTAKADRRWLIPAGIAAAVALSVVSGWWMRGGGGTAAEPAPQRLLSTLEKNEPEGDIEDVSSLSTTYDGDPRRWELTELTASPDATSVVDPDGKDGNVQPESQQRAPDAPDDAPESSMPVQEVEPLLRPAKETPQPAKATNTQQPAEAAPAHAVLAPTSVVKEETPRRTTQALAEAVPVGAGPAQSAPMAPGHLVVEVRSSVKQGALYLFLDDKRVFKKQLAAEGGLMNRMAKKGEGGIERFETQLDIPAGKHRLHALVYRSKGKEWRETLALEIESERTYSVVARLGRIMGVGTGLSLKLESVDEAGLTATPEGL